MKRSTIIIAVIALIVIIGGVYALSKNNPSPSPSPSPTSTASTSPSTSATSSPSSSPSASSGTTADVTSAGFGSDPIKVKSGQTLTFTNKSTSMIQVDSDPHPVHTDNTELNVGQIAPGESKSVTPVRKGTFGIHNHLNSSQHGTVVVE